MIGIFDSGVGGLSVLKEFLRIMPQYSYVYLGDTARMPYGSKSPETIERYAMEDAAFLIERGAKIIVAACNTVSAVAIPRLRAEISFPVFEVITPAVLSALAKTKNGRIGVLGTRATIGSSIYRESLLQKNGNLKIYETASPLIVPFIEEGEERSSELKRILRRYLRPLKSRQIDTLILGCTHYPLIHSEFQKIMGKRAALIDGAEALAFSVQRYLAEFPEIERGLNRGGAARFFLSDITPNFARLAQSVLQTRVLLERAKL